MECFLITSRQPYWFPKQKERRPSWFPKQKERRPSWCSQLILWELNSILMKMLSFVVVEKHAHYSTERFHWFSCSALGVKCIFAPHSQPIRVKSIENRSCPNTLVFPRSALAAFTFIESMCSKEDVASC